MGHSIALCMLLQADTSISGIFLKPGIFYVEKSQPVCQQELLVLVWFSGFL